MPTLIELAGPRKVPAARPDNLDADLTLHGHVYRDTVLHAPPIVHGTFEDAIVHVAPGGIVITDVAGTPVDGVSLVAPPSSTEAILAAAAAAPVQHIPDPDGVCVALPARGRGNFSHLLLEGLPMPMYDRVATGRPAGHILIEEPLADVTKGVMARVAPGAAFTSCGPIARYRINQVRALHGLKHPMNLADPLAADTYRDMARQLSDGPKGPERIAILRKQGRRGVTNEAEIATMLEARGFTLITPEDMSFAQQVNAFAHARVIVGVHGAALSSMVFCLSRDVAVVEIVQRHYLTPAFWYLARALGFRYSIVPEKARQPEPKGKFADLLINADDLSRAVDRYI